VWWAFELDAHDITFDAVFRGSKQGATPPTELVQVEK
jgi:hypothetical protein